MKNSWKRFLSMLVVVVMVLSMLPANVFAAGTTITTEQELKDAIAAGGTYTLGTDITVTAAITSSATTTIDLAGHDIDRAGALFTVSAGTLTIKDTVGGGELKGNGSTNGTAVTINGTGHFVLESGTITNFKYSTCPAIRLDSANAYFTMKGGSITANTSSSGGYGAVYAYRGTFTMTGGSIENNTNGSSGGRDVAFGHASQKAEMYISGDAKIGYLNVLQDKATVKISITELTEGASIGPVSVSGSSKLLSTLTTATVTLDDTVVVDGTTYIWKEVVTVEDPEAMVGDTPYEFLADAIANANGAEIDLQKDVTLAKTDITSSVKIDLNGNDINAVGALFGVKAGGDLTILDSVGGGELKGDGSTSGVAITVEGGGKFVLESGAITGFKGYAVRVETSSTFEMSGGSIYGITATGAVFNSRGVFTMSGGSIANATTYALYIGHGSVQAKSYISGTAQIGKVGFYSTAANPTISITELAAGASIGSVATGATITTDETVDENDGVYTYKAPHVHSYTWEITTKPGCNTTGVKTFTCECGKDSYTETLPATGVHEHVEVERVEASCVVDGYVKSVCSCGDVKEETLPAVGSHNYVETVTQAATCTVPGVMTHTCGCGYSYNTEISVIPHSYGEDGFCTCGEPNPAAVAQVGNKLYLSLDAAITAALNEGTATVTVKKDTSMSTGKQVTPGKNLTIDLNGHTVTVTGNSRLFDLTAGSAENRAQLTITDNSAEKDGVLDACNATGFEHFIRIQGYGRFTLAGGKITNVTGTATGAVVRVNQPGAEFIMTDGEISSNTSTGGAVVYAYNGTFEMTGGKIFNNTPKEGNGAVGCYSAGKIKLSGDVYVDTIHAESDFVELGVLTEDAKIVSKGALTYATDYNISRDENGLYVYEVGTHKHDYTYETVITESTCTVAGTKADKCLCGKAKVTDLEKAPHTPVEGSHDCGVCYNVISDCVDAEGELRDHNCDICKEPMVDAPEHVPAEDSHNCAYCGKSADAGCSDASDDQDHNCDICGDPCGGHSYGEWEIVTEPTCGATGLKKKVCNCGDIQTEIIPATGKHNYATEVPGTREGSTCVTHGKVQMACGCGATEWVELPLAADNHADVVTVPGKTPTCTEDGWTESSYCRACNTEIDDADFLSRYGHDYTEVSGTRVASTCNTKGHYIEKCANCGDEKEVELALDLTNHEGYEEVEGSRVASTCNTKGHYIEKCACGDENEVELDLDLTNHEGYEEVEGSRVDSTCTVKGHYIEKCACGDENEVELALDPDNHNYVNGYCSNAGCDEEEPNAPFVAQVGNRKYVHILAAWQAAAAGQGNTITLLADVDLTGLNLVDNYVSASGMTLDLNKKTMYIPFDALSFAGNNFTIMNGTIDGKGADYGLFIGANATSSNNVTIKNVKVVGGVNIHNANGVTLDNVTATGRNYYAVWVEYTANNVEILSGTYTAAAGKPAVNSYYEDNLTVKGGEYSSDVTKYCGDDNHTVAENGVFVYDEHSYSSVVTKPTCTEPGITTHTCACGKSYTSEPTDALGHQDVVIVNAKPATLNEKGYTGDEFCNVCQTIIKKGEEIDYLPGAVAEVNGIKYASLKEAIEAAAPGATVTLLDDAIGSGVVINKSITIDFAGNTYTVVGQKADGLVGSTNTETLGFQILSGDVTLQGGTLATDTDACKMLVQNYANLTLIDITLDGTGSANMKYVLSNNCGDVALTGATNITAPAGAVAFDVCEFQSYKAPSVTVETSGTITGKIEVSGGELEVNAGTFVSDGDIFVVTSGKLTIDGGDFTAVDNVVYIRGGDVVINDGTMESTGGAYAAIQGNGLAAGNVTINGGTIESADVGIYWPQDGALTITGGTITGTTAVYVKSGTITIEGGNLIANGDKVDYNPNNNAGNSTGDALVVENSKNPNYEDAVVSVTGGVFTSANGNAVASYAEAGVEVLPGFVSGGEFNTPVAENACAAGFIPADDGNGNYGVKVGKYVAEVGGVKYETLNAAATAAQSGTITLLDNVDVIFVQLNEGVTLDFAGYTVSGTVLGKIAVNGGNYVTAEGYKMIGADADYYYTTDAVFTMTGALGDIAILSGTVELVPELWYTGVGQTLTIEQGATFIIGEGKTLYVNGSNVIVNGTAVNNGTIKIANGATVKGTILGKFEMAGGTYITAEGYKMIGADADYYYTTDAVFTMTGVTGDITLISGTVELVPELWYTLPGQTLTVEKNAKFVIPAGKALYVNDSTVIVNGVAENNGTVIIAEGGLVKGDIAGTFQMAGGNFATSKYTMAGVADDAVYYTTDAVFTIAPNATLDTTIVSGEMTLQANNTYTLPGQTLVIEAGAKFVIPAGINMNINKANVVINGTAVVEGTVTLYSADATVAYADDGALLDKFIARENETVIYENGVYKAHNHDYSTVKTEPTCTEGGYTTYTCGCGDTYNADEVAAKGHKYVGTETKAPACEVAGVMTYVCDNCGDTYDEAIDALEHNYVGVTTEPTCEDKGYTTYTCDICGDHYDADEVAAEGHSYGDWYEKVAATCLVDGELRRDCTNCSHYETDVITATGHNYSSSVTAPTCTAQGFTTHTCGNCGHSYVDTYTDMIDHSYGEGVVTLEPTTTTEGVMTYTCGSCGHEKTEPIPVVVPSVSIKIASAAVLFKDEIKIQFKYNISGVSGDYLSNAGIEVWSEEDYDPDNLTNPTKVYTGLKLNGTRYEITTDGIPAKNMGDLYYYRGFVEVDGEKVYTSYVLPYSAVEYSKYHIGEAVKNSTNQELMDNARLCIALMNYGAEAQKYFETKGTYTYTTLMNSFITAEQQTWLTTTADIAPLKSVPTCNWEVADPATIKINGIVGVFKGSLEMVVKAPVGVNGTVKMYYWTEAAAEGGLRIEDASEMTDVHLNGTRYEGRIPGVAAKNIGDTIYMCAAVEVDGVTYYSKAYCYSMHEYCKNEMNNSTSDMSELGRALIIYSNFVKYHLATY